MTIDKWVGLSLTELLAERHALEAKINAVRSITRQAVIEEVRQLVATYGLTPLKVMPLTQPRNSAAPARPTAAVKKIPAKYYDPNSGQTWTGRGKAPRWIAGQDYNKFLIPAEGILRQMAQQLPADPTEV